MLIKFTSNINHAGKANKIEFSAPVEISDYQKFKVYEFNEPSINERNRIEIADDEINIMTGANTLNLSLGEKLPVAYLIKGAGEVFFKSQLHRVNQKEMETDFKYSLFDNNDQLIGEYEINILISKEN